MGKREHESQRTVQTGVQQSRRQISAKQRAQRRKRKLVIFYLCLFLTVVIAAAVLSLTVLFQVDTIAVSGETRYSQEEIIEASGLKTGDNLFLSDTATAEAALPHKLPYLQSVKVSRSFPAQLNIEVQEATVAGAISQQSGYLLISPQGKALEAVSTIPEGCPVILGLELSKAEVGELVEYKDEQYREVFESLTKAFQDNGMTEVTKLYLGDLYSISAEYDGRILMNFGLPSDLDYKVRFAKSVFESGGIGADECGTFNLSEAKSQERVSFLPAATVPQPANTSQQGGGETNPETGTSSEASSAASSEPAVSETASSESPSSTESVSSSAPVSSEGAE